MNCPLCFRPTSAGPAIGNTHAACLQGVGADLHDRHLGASPLDPSTVECFECHRAVHKLNAVQRASDGKLLCPLCTKRESK